MQFCGIEGFGRFVKDGSGGSSGSAGLNFFTQLDEPSIKDGVWIKTNSKYENILTDQRLFNDDGVWTKFTPTPFGLQNGSSVLLNDEIHILGGSLSDTTKVQHYKFNESNNTWTSVSTLPYSFYNGSAVVLNNEIHILGGEGGSSNHYKFNGSAWTALGTTAYPFDRGSALIFNGELHILGSKNQLYSTYHYKYNAIKDRWTSVSELPIRFADAGAVVYYGDIHLIGSGSGYVPDNAHYKFNGTVWTSVCTLDVPTFYNSCVVYNNCIHMLGGENNAGKQRKFDGISWSDVGSLPNKFKSGCAVVKDNYIVMLGGSYTVTSHKRFSASEYEFSPKTIIVQRGDHNGVYLTNFVNTPEITGEHNRFVTGFDNVWYFDTDAFDTDAEMYYGDGTKWIKFKN